MSKKREDKIRVCRKEKIRKKKNKKAINKGDLGINGGIRMVESEKGKWEKGKKKDRIKDETILEKCFFVVDKRGIRRVQKKGLKRKERGYLKSKGGGLVGKRRREATAFFKLWKEGCDAENLKFYRTKKGKIKTGNPKRKIPAYCLRGPYFINTELRNGCRYAEKEKFIRLKKEIKEELKVEEKIGIKEQKMKEGGIKRMKAHETRELFRAKSTCMETVEERKFEQWQKAKSGIEEDLVTARLLQLQMASKEVEKWSIFKWKEERVSWINGKLYWEKNEGTQGWI